MPAEPAPPLQPPVDLNRPVENPALSAALARAADDASDDAKDALFHALQGAVFLAAILTDEMQTAPDPDAPGRVTIARGSALKFLTAGHDGRHYLPLFTDWPALRAYTAQDVSALVLPAADAWAFALHDSTYHGVVINPGPVSLPLERPMLEHLARAAAPPGAAP